MWGTCPSHIDKIISVCSPQLDILSCQTVVENIYYKSLCYSMTSQIDTFMIILLHFLSPPIQAVGVLVLDCRERHITGCHAEANLSAQP